MIVLLNNNNIRRWDETNKFRFDAWNALFSFRYTIRVPHQHCIQYTMLECPMMTCRLNEHTLSINNKYTERAKRSRKNKNLAYFDRTLHPSLCHFGDETDSTITIDSKRINRIKDQHQSYINLWVFMSANSYFDIDIYTFFSRALYSVQCTALHVSRASKLQVIYLFMI